MTIIKMLGCGSVTTADRRKLRRLGRIANKILQKTGVYTPVKIKRLVSWEVWYYENGEKVRIKSTSFSIQGGWWENLPYVRDKFEWKSIRKELVPQPFLTQEEWERDGWVENMQED